MSVATARRRVVALNFGSGHFPMSRPWRNVDCDPSTPADEHYAAPPIRANDSSVDDIYAGHFLEHLSQEQGAEFLRECFRVLKPAGRLGLVVPDTRLIMQVWLSGEPVVVEMPAGKFWRCNDLDDVCSVFLFSTYQSTPHLWAFDAGTLRRAGEAAGFKYTGEIDRYGDPRVATGRWYQVGCDFVKPEP